MKTVFIPLAIILLIITIVAAHSEEFESTKPLTDTISQTALNIMYIAIIIILISTLISIFYEKKLRKYKIYLFLAIAIPAIVATIALAASTIYLNSVAITKGPVHWHADFEIWNCGERIEIKDPGGFSNRIGSPTFHEHNDNRIHVEGVLVNKKDASLGNFFRVLGGNIYDEGFEIPTNKGLISVENGNLCKGNPGKLQVFVYKTEKIKYFQEEIEHFDDYILSPYGDVPPGDCIIVEFDSEIREKTNHICETYKIAQERGDIHSS